MKRIFAIFLTIITLFSILELNSYTTYAKDNQPAFLTEGNWIYTVDNENNITIAGYKGSEAEVYIPGKINGAVVTSVGEAAFYNSKIESIIIPDTVREIGWWAFYGCESLSKVNFGKGIKSIDYGAFMNCTSLKSVELPMQVTFLDNDAFAVSCKTTKNVNDIYSHTIVSTQKYKIDTSFEISGYSGTVVEKYAQDNGLAFNSFGKVSYGDVDRNGVVDVKDAELIKKYLNGDARLRNIQQCNADTDNDGEVTENDVKLINRYINNEISLSGFLVAENLYDSVDYLSGKRIYCDGDSVAKGSGTNILGDSFYSYCHYIAETYNMKMTNNAVGGTTLAKKQGQNNSILERVKKMKGNYDVILLDGGFNDLFQKIKIGNVTDINDKSGNYDEYTTAGALESICYFLQKNYKNSVKLFVLCHRRNTEPEQYKYWDVIKQVLEKWEIDYIDLSEETDFCDVNEEITNQYFMFRNGKGDGIHPLKYANQKIYGPKVARKLNSVAGNAADISTSQKEITLEYPQGCSINIDCKGYSSCPELNWTTDNEKVAAVDSYGNVTINGVGTTVIKACSPDNKCVSITVNVRLPISNLAQILYYNPVFCMI